MSENRQMRIASLPRGALQASDFELCTSSIPEALTTSGLADHSEFPVGWYSRSDSAIVPP